MLGEWTGCWRTVETGGKGAEDVMLYNLVRGNDFHLIEDVHHVIQHNRHSICETRT